MKQNKIALLSLLAVSPLFLANSPAPYATVEDYTDISVVCNSVTEVSNGYAYDLSVTNTGDYYALLNQGMIINDRYFYGDVEEELFFEEAIAPKQSKTFKYVSTEKYEDLENAKWAMRAFTYLDSGITFSDLSIEYQGNKMYAINGKGKGDGDYYYCCIMELTYEDTTYYVSSKLNFNKKLAYFTTTQEIDASKITLKQITAYRSVYNTYKGGKILAYIIYGFIGLIILFVLLIPAAIIIPVSIAKSRHRKNQEINH